MSCGLKKSEWVDILSKIHDNLESIEAKSFKETKEDFEEVLHKSLNANWTRKHNERG